MQKLQLWTAGYISKELMGLNIKNWAELQLLLNCSGPRGWSERGARQWRRRYGDGLTGVGRFRRAMAKFEALIEWKARLEHGEAHQKLSSGGEAALKDRRLDPTAAAWRGSG